MLSTPPAFILSQDQTLMLWSEFRRNLLLRVTSAKRNFSCDTSRFPVKSLFRWNDFSVRAHPRSGSLMRAHPVIPSKSSIWITYPGQINLAIAVNLWLIANQKFSFLIYCLRFRSLKELTYGNFLPLHVKSFKVFHCSVIKVLMECIPVISYAFPVVRSRGQLDYITTM